MKRGKAPSSGARDSASDDDASVTSLGEPGLLRERAPEIERGYVLAGRYQVEAVIGKGGSGVVLRAFDRTAQMPVAIKVLKSELAKDERWSRRFARELRLGRPIRHPNVCRIFDINEADGHKFLTMELATGGTLRDVIKKGEPLRPFEERLADASAAIAGLAAIHEAGIVHRDVKPDNMLRMEDGRLAISDFGLATDLSNSQMVTVMVGTPHYMAPEVRAGEPATTRSDVWSLGVVLHEIFFGRRPERRSSASKEGMSRPAAPLTSSPIERAMLALCEACMADNPFDRPSDAKQVQILFGNGGVGRGRLSSLVNRRVFVAVGLASLAGLVFFAIRTRGVADRGGAALPPLVEPEGRPADWTDATVLASLPSRTHCFSVVDSQTVRVIWGDPRAAEDINILSGARRPAPIRAETYRNGCPDLSPRGDRILYSAVNEAGMSEIRLSENAAGDAGKPITPGVEPLWLRNGEEFLYTIDPYHAAIFSLSTMSFALLPDSGTGARQLVSEKAVSLNEDAVALRLIDDAGRLVIAIYEGRSPRLATTIEVAAGYRVSFGASRGQVFLSYDLSRELSTLAVLSWSTGKLRHLGRYPGFDLVQAQEARDDATVLLARRRQKDAWLFGASGKEQVTYDGETSSAAISPNGDLLLGKRGADGRFAIWSQRRGLPARPVTSGPLDSQPAFSADGRLWTYVDYAKKSIMICESETFRCHERIPEDRIPVWPSFSPDGKHIAYIRQADGQRVVVLSLPDLRTMVLGVAFGQCPPVWSSPDRLLVYEGSAKRYFWSEWGINSGKRTGKRITLGDAANDAVQQPDETRCWPAEGSAESAVFPRLRIETKEESRLVRLPSVWAK